MAQMRRLISATPTAASSGTASCAHPQGRRGPTLVDPVPALGLLDHRLLHPVDHLLQPEIPRASRQTRPSASASAASGLPDL